MNRLLLAKNSTIWQLWQLFPHKGEGRADVAKTFIVEK